MEPIKDVQRTDNVSRYLDGKHLRTDPFGGNRAGERAYRRTERIVAALHLLTNHLPQSEAVRASIRNESLVLIDHILALRDEMRSSESTAVLNAQSSIRKLISLIRIAAVAGFISLPNADIVIDALDELGNFIQASEKSAFAERVTISKEELLDVHAQITRSISTRYIKDKKDNTNLKDTIAVKDTQNASLAMSVSVRRQSIIEVLRSGGSLGIRDIAGALPEYSEKMIQRELLELVAGGSVRKSGLKRWSRYALATI